MALKILVADDSPTIQKVIKIALSRFLVEVVSVTDYNEALEELNQTKFDAMITDAGLSGTKGPADFQAFLKTGRNTQLPILILVGSYESVDESTFVAAGLTHFMRKPFESSDVVQTLTKLLKTELPINSARPPTDPGQIRPPEAYVRPPQPTILSHEYPTPPPPGPRQSVVTTPPGQITNPGIESALATPPPVPTPQQIPSPMMRPSSLVTSQNEIPPFIPSHGEMTPPPPPPPAEPRRGQKAFSADDVLAPMRAAAAEQAQKLQSNQAVNPTKAPQVSDAETKQLMRQVLLEYCEKHFATLAREVITAEIRRLTEERTKQLSDT
jgi:CheY-like chemotaxis protein